METVVSEKSVCFANVLQSRPLFFFFLFFFLFLHILFFSKGYVDSSSKNIGLILNSAELLFKLQLLWCLPGENLGFAKATTGGAL